MENCSVCTLYSIPIDKACGASLVRSPLTDDFKEVVWSNVQDVGPFICSCGFESGFSQ